MKITRVTITGADDKVSHQALAGLAQEYPWLELGVLHSDRMSGEPRYPSDRWRHGIFRVVEPSQLALHFCGYASRSAMSGIVDGLPFVPDGCRLQINGFGPWRLPGLLLAHARQDLQIILQCDGQNAIGNALRLTARHSNVVALLDTSGGTGRYQPEAWTPPPAGLAVGYAGGINEFNIESVVEQVASMPGEGAAWIDLETGARNAANEFDLEKARRILELVRPAIARAA
jgi:hypothetical protein